MRRPVFVLAVVCASLAASGIARAQSAADGFDPAPNGSVLAMAEQSDGRILIGGDFTTLFSGSVSRARLARLNHDGGIDPAFDPGVNGTVSGLGLQPDGKILVGGTFTLIGGGGSGSTARSNIARLNADGTVDASFDPGANGLVSSLLTQPDGRILVGGGFTTLGGGGTGTTTRNRIGRIESSGALDLSFDPGATSFVNAMAVEPDGQILVAGAFTGLGGGSGTTTRNRIGRLNSDGTVDSSFDPGANQVVYALALQPDGKAIVGGLFTGLGGGTGATAKTRLGRINADGSLDAGFTTTLDSPTAVQAIALQADGRIVIGGAFNKPTAVSTHTYFLRLLSDGALDDAFAPAVVTQVQRILVQRDGGILTGGFSNVFARWYPSGALDAIFDPGANDRVFAVAAQPDDKIIVGGDFTMIGGGGTGGTARSKLARLNADGSVDTTFDPGANGAVYALAMQPDGKILVGGQYTSIGGGGTGNEARARLARLNPDGTIDAGFATIVSGLVSAIAVYPDGRILVNTGATLDGVTRYKITRLFGDGTLDPSFNQGVNTRPESIYTLAVDSLGRVLVGGYFTQLNGASGLVTRNYLARLNDDGTLDESFNPGANSSILAFAVQPDDRILVGGGFTTMGGGGTGSTSRLRIARLLDDGSVDPDFNPGAASGGLRSVHLQQDGGAVLSGNFVWLGGGTANTARSGIGRVDTLGGLDTGFDPGSTFPGVRGVARQADGKLVVVGEFTTLGGGGTGLSARSRIGRLVANEPAVAGLDVSADGTTVTWRLSSSAPLFTRVALESSSDGSTWAPLGDAARTSTGWSLGNVILAENQNVWVRARGYAYTGDGNGSRTIVEAVRQAYVNAAKAAPAFTQHPQSQTVVVGNSVTLDASASGLPLPSYRWQVSTDDGGTWSAVPDAAPFSGMFTRTLAIDAATASLQGNRFRVVASNGVADTISAAATLTVTAAPLTELVANGTFAGGTSGWLLHSTPDMSYLQSQVTDGVFEFYRVAPPPGTSNQATIFRQTGVAVASGAPLVATFDLGNSSSVRKRISVLVLDSNFSDLSVCTFWLPASAPLATYVMRTHTTKTWANAAIYFYAATSGSAGGYYRLDNVSLQYDPSESAQQTTCTDPNAPAAGAGDDGPNLLTNGDFTSGALAPGWGTYGTITTQVTGGVAEFIRPTNTAPAGVVLQATGQAFPSGHLMKASFQLGNSSGVRKRVTAILHDNNFTDLSACTFWLAPGAPLANYALRTYATQAWTNATLSFYPATTGTDEWIQLDNVSLQHTPSATIAGTDCQEPGVALRPALGTRVGIVSTASVTALPPTLSSTASLRSAPAAAANTFAFTAELGHGWALAASGVVASATVSGVSILRLREVLDLRVTDTASLEFLSHLDARASTGEVQVRTDDGEWETVAEMVAGPLEWRTVDLAMFAGTRLEVQFVFNAVAGEPLDTWTVSDIRLER